jgi:hypothetical protein
MTMDSISRDLREDALAEVDFEAGRLFDDTKRGTA